jgi:hypothetical protein
MNIADPKDAELICSLVNAAQEIGEPMKVANNLKAMYDALKAVYDDFETPNFSPFELSSATASKVKSV